MSKSLKQKTASFLYDIGWKAAMPILRRNKRLEKGFDRRTLKDNLPPEADIWIQAASAGEASLASEILKTIDTGRPTKILVTTNTDQGLQELEKTAYHISRNLRQVTATATYFPFDMPSLMHKALEAVKPKLVVLLETEIWPGFLGACKELDIPVLILNARMTTKSLAGYMSWPGLFRSMAPKEILAISEDDATRFKTLFESENISVMPNIKFDRTRTQDLLPYTSNPVSSALKPKTPFIILGSVRREEEAQVRQLVSALNREKPKTVIGLFPRHMHRIEAWEKMLTEDGIQFVLRSEIDGHAPFGSVVLWDVFGEMVPAFSMARAAFIGGSLAPVGGQNFLEPLSYGITPVIGPYWSNFAWVGQEIIDSKLVRQADNWEGVLEEILDITKRASKPDRVKNAFNKYLETRSGGIDLACEAIIRNLP